jgi:hypothetical protein
LPRTVEEEAKKQGSEEIKKQRSKEAKKQRSKEAKKREPRRTVRSDCPTGRGTQDPGTRLRRAWGNLRSANGSVRAVDWPEGGLRFGQWVEPQREPELFVCYCV